MEYMRQHGGPLSMCAWHELQVWLPLLLFAAVGRRWLPLKLAAAAAHCCCLLHQPLSTPLPLLSNLGACSRLSG